MRARHPDAATRTVLPIIVVSAVVLATFTGFGPNSASSTTRLATWATIVLLAGLTAVLALVPAERLDRAGVLVGLAVGSVLLVDVMNLVTRDASAAAQAFLAFPVVWGAAHLRRGAVVCTTSLAVVTNAGVAGVLLPPHAAVPDALAFGAVLVVIAVMLLRAGEEQERLVAMLQQQATVDSLTGLVNRRVLDDALARALTEPTGPLGVALVLVDIDAFKTVNDQHGHPVGDDALVHVAGLLRSVVRAGDAVLSRVGGDELAVLLPECPPDVAARRAGQLLDAVRSTPLVLDDGTALALSVSLGVAHAPTSARGLEGLYAAADAALYAAKRGGRDRLAVAGT
jgi:diguanylate cyclase (GGDEF)-like protein